MHITAKEEYFDEPECERNKVAVEKKTCKTPMPGSSTGGCALDGAYIVLSPIKDALNIVHGPINCLANGYNQRTSAAVGKAGYYMYGLTTAMNETDLIFGSEEKLRQGVIQAYERFRPSAIFIYNTCVPALTGEDVEGVSAGLAAALKIPVIPVLSQGFSGNKNLGNKIAGDALFKHLIGNKNPGLDIVSNYNINLLGEYNIKGELFIIKKALKSIGVNVLSTITGDSTIEEIMYSHKSGLNVVICSKALVYLARKMKEKFGIHYIEESFFGMSSANRAIINIANSTGDAAIIENAKKYIKIRSVHTEKNILEYKKFLTGKKALLYTGGVKSWSFISALNDIGLRVVATGIKKSTDGDKARIKEFDENGNIILLDNGNPLNLIKIAEENNVDIILAGGRNQYTAIKSLIPFVDVNQERLDPYVSYEGLELLAKRIYHEIKNPVFSLLKEDTFNIRQF